MENSIRNRIIRFQNQAEEAYENQKSISNTIRYVLAFWAEWCGPCIMMEPILKKFATQNNEVVVGKVNADHNNGLVKRYKIRGLPQILLIKNGEEIKRNAGALSITELANFVKD